jgi:hypothetical protein
MYNITLGHRTRAFSRQIPRKNILNTPSQDRDMMVAINHGFVMPLTITPDRYAAIREKLKQRQAEALAAEIVATDWNDLPHFTYLIIF